MSMSVAMERRSTSISRMSPANVILWSIVKPHRSSLAVVLCYWATMAVLANTGLYHALIEYHSMMRSALAALVLIPAFGIPLFFAVMFTLSLNVEEPGCLSYLRRLPIATASLVGLPMLWGSLMIGGSWIVIKLTVLNPIGFSIPLLPSTAAYIGGLFILQALAWAPMRADMRGLLFMVVLALLFTTSVYLSMRYEDPTLFLRAFDGLSVLAVGAAFAGVRASRRGDVIELDRLRRFLVSLSEAVNRRPRFSGVDGPTAQMWYERTIEGFPLAGIMIWLLVITSPALFGPGGWNLVEGPAAWNQPIIGITCLTWVKIITYAPLFPLVFAGVMGNNPMTCNYGYLRPLSTAQVAWIKLRAALWGVGTTVLLLAALVAVALLTPAVDRDRHGLLGALLLNDLDKSAIGPIVLAVLCYVVVLVRVRVDGMWSATMRWSWMSAVNFFWPFLAGLFLLFLKGSAIANYISIHLTAIAIASLAAKIVAYALVSSMLVRQAIVAQGDVFRQIGIWLACAAGISIVAWEALPPAWAVPLWTIIALSIVAVPTVRVSLLPWAIDKRRHQ